MMHFTLFIICGLFTSLSSFSQDPSHNALPPGPTRILGKIEEPTGEPIPGALITVKYPDGKQRKVDTFVSNNEGFFQASIFRYDQPYVELVICVNRKVCAIKRYEQPGLGMNLGHQEPPVICNVHKKRKH